MELGPPCTCTTMAYFFAASKLAGYKSQPCRLKPSFCQWILLASPHAGLSPALLDVICFHSPIGPAQTSGGCAAIGESQQQFCHQPPERPQYPSHKHLTHP